MQITLRVQAGAILGKFQRIRAEVPVVAEKTLETVLKRVKRTMQVYPPERSGQRYIRTYKFKNSWKITRQVRGYKIENTATRKGRRYAQYPAGDATGQGQAWMHVGRWLLFRDVVDYEMTKLPDSVENEINLVITKAGMAK